MLSKKNKTGHKIHDSLFKEALSYCEVAESLIKGYLDTDEILLLAWDTLKQVNTEFINQDLSQQRCDVLYECKLLGKESRVYFFLEHQTKPDPKLPRRIKRYNEAIDKYHLENIGKKLPIIINICIYAGKKTPYPYSTNIYDSFEEPELAKKYIFRSLRLIDLNTKSDNELLSQGASDMLQILLKLGNKKESLGWIKENSKLIFKLLRRSYSYVGLFYILKADLKNNPDDVLKALAEIIPQKKDNIMNLAQQLVEKGVQQGIQQGVQQGIQTTIINVAKGMLAINLDLNSIHLVTKLSKETLQKLKNEMINS